VTALEIVACDSPNSAAARAKEPVSATLAKIAQASRSGSLCMAGLMSIHTDIGKNVFLLFPF
jgi:hypothetical protein